MKFYIHCEEPEFTMVIRLDDDSQDTVAELKQIFIDNFMNKFKDRQATDKTQQIIELYQGKKIFSNKDIVVKKIKHMADIYARWIPAASSVKTETASVKKGTSTKMEEKHRKPQTGPDAQGATSQSQGATPQGATSQSQGATPQGATSYGAASSEQPLKIDDILKVASSLYEKSHIRKAVLLYEDILRIDKHNITAYMGIVDSYLKAGRPEKALNCVKRAQKNHPGNRELIFKECKCYLDLGEADKSLEETLRYCKDMRKIGGVDTARKHEAQVMLAKAYQLKGQVDMSITILQGVLREDREHLDALVDYATLIFLLGPAQKEDAMAILLTALASKRNDKYIKEKFASICKHQHGMTVLKSVSDSAWQDVASLVFMATSLRDCGAVDEALDILDHAYNIQPDNAHTLLTYVHTMELVEKHSEGVHKIKEFIKTFPQQRAGNFTCGMLQPVLDCFHGNIYLNSDSSISGLSAPELQIYSDSYTEYELYVLALVFTLVKMLYVKGALQYVPIITKILDPCCEGHDLHQTNIRNEAAYYTCISQVLKLHNEPPVLSPDCDFVYFIGDSHCMSPAWQNIQLQNSRKVIHPVLSTGTKIWHLRGDSNFYPKTDFYSSISVIPDNATVITCFGEIDCREALLLCVEKGKYDTIEEAINCVIDIYIKVLTDLKQQYIWDIYVHPVMPILDITRSLVMHFNKLLSERLKKEGHLKWLEFVDELLDTSGDKSHLKSKYDFDGTHGHPCYISLLEKAMNDST